MNKKVRKTREQRIRRTRAKISGTSTKPRLAVFRSNKHISVQLIDDTIGKTLAFAHSEEIKDKKKTKTQMATAVGELIAQKAKEAKIESVVFDKRYYKYHGRVKAVAEGAISKGLKI